MPSTPRLLIRLDHDYPCPCCKGVLVHLALTEALGCCECQRIFVLTDGRRAIANLGAISSRHQKRWRWTGKEWYLASGQWHHALVAYAVFVILAVLSVGLFYAFWSSPNVQSLSQLIQVSVLLMLPLVLWALWSHRYGRESR